MQGSIMICVAPGKTPEGAEAVQVQCKCSLVHVSVADQLTLLNIVMEALKFPPYMLPLLQYYAEKKPYDKIDLKEGDNDEV